MIPLADLAQLAANATQNPAQVPGFEIRGAVFEFHGEAHLMGVVNLSPDSWYRESVCLSADAAIRRGRVLHAQGARLVDLGAESSLAHAARVDPERQSRGMIPVIRELAGAGVLVSVESYHPAVARACLEAGASVLNLTGTRDEDEHFRMVAAHGAGLILCHVQGNNVREVGDFNPGSDPVSMLYEDLAPRLERARALGVSRVFLDPGLGFYYRNLQDSAVRIRHQMQVFLTASRLRSLGAPLCNALPHAFECFGEEVRSAEPFFAVLAALGATDLFRTHEVSRTRAVLETLRLWSVTGTHSHRPPARAAAPDHGT